MLKKYKGQLVCQHLENISRDVLEKYQGIIRSFVKGRHGVYALYRKGKLYYVGLASNLKNRLKHHLQDRHAQSWDRFSIYFTISDNHLKDLETLVLRISTPKGNIIGGSFIRSEDLKSRFRKQIVDFQKRELYGLFEEDRMHNRTNVKPMDINKKLYPLSKYFKKRTHIRFGYKGDTYIAHVRLDGTITFPRESAGWSKLKGKIFKSPSQAASAVTKRPMNGWRHWKYERSPGEWILLDELRK
jgi:hypothetical protein